MIPYVDLVAHNAALADELCAVVRRVIAHGQMILGPEVVELERRLSERHAGHAVSVANGTDALILALRLRGIGPGDEVVVPSHSFVATALAVRLVGATPVFADVDDETMTLDPVDAAAAVGPRTRAVIPVHLNGHPCDLDALGELCDARGLAMIEDCAQAFGTQHRGRPVGRRELGCFSLHPLKALAALGDGGFVVARDPDDATRLRQLRNLGLRDRDHCDVISGNSRLDTLQAGFLLVKLDHFDRWRAARAAHAAAYRAALGAAVRLPPDGADTTVTAFVVRHPRRDALIERLRARGVDAKVHYPLAIHQQAAFADLPARPLPVTERVVREIVSLPVTPELDVAGRDAVIAAVLAAVEEVG